MFLAETELSFETLATQTQVCWRRTQQQITEVELFQTPRQIYPFKSNCFSKKLKPAVQAATSFSAGRLGRKGRGEGGREREGRSGQKVPEQVAPLPPGVTPFPPAVSPLPQQAEGTLPFRRSEGALREMPRRRPSLRGWLGKRVRSADIPHHRHSQDRAKLMSGGDAEEQPPPPRRRSRARLRRPRDPVSGPGLTPYLPSPLRAAAPRSFRAAASPPQQVCLKRPPHPAAISHPLSLPPSLSLFPSLVQPAGKKPAAPGLWRA